MTKHTPGPWRFKAFEDDFASIIADHGKAWDNPIICDLYEDVTPEDSVTFGRWLKAYPNANANARLIAAAPDMLAALKLAEQNATDRTALAAIRAAIAKAQGEG